MSARAVAAATLSTIIPPMRQTLDRFILSIPTLFIKQYPYAWIPLVFLWTWPPTIVLIFLLVIVVGLASLQWRSAAWISEMRRQHAPRPTDAFLVQRTPVPWMHFARTVGTLLVIAAGAAWLLGEFVGLGAWRFFVLIVGFALCYLDARFVGAETIYAVAPDGIAIYFMPGHVDYRIFVAFKEMRRVQRLDAIASIPATWSVCARLRKPTSGVLLVPRSPQGFSRRLQEILVVPPNVDDFLKRVPSTLVNEL